MFFGTGIFAVKHQWADRDDLYTFQQHVEVFNLLSCVIDAVPLKFGAFQRLAFCHSFVEVGASFSNVNAL